MIGNDETQQGSQRKPDAGQVEPKKRGKKSRFDYDSDEFYEVIFQQAMFGATDAEIADSISDELGFYLSPSTFHKMVTSNYDRWTEEENERRGTRIKRVLERARRNVNKAVRARYLKMALGGYKTKNVTTVSRRMRIDGELTDNEDIQTSVTEIESPPSLQALSIWLHHHDPEWRKYEGAVQEDMEDDPNAIPVPKKGINITAWIDKEVQDKAEKELTEVDNIPENDIPSEDIEGL